MKEKFKVFAINLITMLVLALLLEFAIYYGLAHPKFIPKFLRQVYRSFYKTYDRNIIQISGCARYDSTLFYRLRTGECTFSNREFAVVNRINSRGLRDNEASLNNPAIIVLGDSYAMGWGVEQHETFPEILEQISGNKVLNAAISSFGTARQMKLLRELYAGPLKCVVIQYHANDYIENVTFVKNNYSLLVRSPEQYDSLKRARSKRKYFPFSYLAGFSKSCARTLLWKGSNDYGHEIRAAETFLDILLNAMVTKDLPIIVFKLDTIDKLNRNFIQAMDSLLQLEKYKTLQPSVKPVYIGTELTEDDYFILDDHINAQGHRKVAGELHRILKPLL